MRQARAIVMAVIALALAVGLAWGMLTLASGGDGPVRLQLGEDEFRTHAARMSKQIAEDGPVLMPDVSGRGQRRPAYFNHFGDDPTIRWVVFSAAAPGHPEECFVSWSPERELFEVRAAEEGAGRDRGELCSDETYPPTGEGLEQFDWKVDDEDILIVDLRGDDEADATGD